MSQSHVKELACYCHWGGERKLKDGQISYEGGVIDLVAVNTRTTYEEFVHDVCNALGITHTSKTFHYTSKHDNMELIQLQDDRGLGLMCRFNNDLVDVYVSEVPLATSPHIISTRGSNNGLQSPTPTALLYEEEIEPSHQFDSEETNPMLPIASQVSAIAYITLPKVVEGLNIEEGQIYTSLNNFKQAVTCFAFANNFSFEYLNNSRSYYRIVCKVPDCKWKLTAGCEGNSDVVRVKKFNNTHCHTAHDVATYKPVVRSKYIGNMIKDKIAETPGYLPGQIRKDFEASMSVKMSYHQAWWAKERAKSSITGEPKDSFKFVPWMCERLRQSIPGTRASYILSDDGRFKQLFVAYGCSITGFMVSYRPMLFIDACHLTAYYRGVLMSACGVDANNGLYPLAYSFASAENYENWLWFLQELKHILGDRVVVLMTDRNPSLLLGIKELFGEEYNSWCLRHLKENFSKFMLSKGIKNKRRETGLKMLTNIAYARDERMFHHYLVMLHNFNPEMADWVKVNGPEHWENSQFRMKRWDWMYTNPAESFNAWLGPLRECTIFQFMKDHVLKQTTFLTDKKVTLEKCKTRVGHRIEEKIRDSQERSMGCGYRNSLTAEYTVTDRSLKRYAVKLLAHECSCFEWQMTGIPCPHAMVVMGPSGLNVYDMVENWFKNETQQYLLQFMIPPVHTHDEPTVEELSNISSSSSMLSLVPLPPISKRPPGRPRKKRIESQHQDKRVIHCSRCGMPGHNRKNCKEPIPD